MYPHYKIKGWDIELISIQLHLRIDINISLFVEYSSILFCKGKSSN